MIAVVVPYWWHASILELLWLIGGVVALPFALRNLREAAEDENIIEPMRYDPSVHSRHFLMVQRAAKGQTLDHWLTVVVSSLIVVAGAVACAVPNPLGGTVTPTSFAITICLLGISAATVLRAVSAMSIRRELDALAEGRSSVIAAELRANAARDNPSKKEEK